MRTQISQRLGKGRQGFGRPGRLANRKRLALQQLLSKDRDEGKQARASAGVVRRIARSDQWRCVSTPRWARTSGKVTSTVQRRTNHATIWSASAC
ncbi:MAG TPA: hypothetical protein VGF67_01465 [Ktedonobacteraceae bacterium]